MGWVWILGQLSYFFLDASRLCKTLWLDGFSMPLRQMMFYVVQQCKTQWLVNPMALDSFGK